MSCCGDSIMKCGVLLGDAVTLRDTLTRSLFFSALYLHFVCAVGLMKNVFCPTRQIVLSKMVNKNRDAHAVVKQLIFPNAYPLPGAAPTANIASSALAATEAPPKSGSLGLFAPPNRAFKASSSSTATGNILRKTQSDYIPRNAPASTIADAKSAFEESDTKPANHIDPRDCPNNSLRYELIKLMTSLDTQIKRIVAEFVFSLCNNNGKQHTPFSSPQLQSFAHVVPTVNEFVYRTGFGNSVALLQLKGLI